MKDLILNNLPCLDKYAYVRGNAYIIRFVGLLGVLAAVVMGLGFYNFLHISFWYTVLFGPLVLLLTLNKFCRYLLQLFYPKFSIAKHERFVREFWAERQEPSVDVFLPYAGEEIDVHEKVVKAVCSLNYSNYKVYMLDDSTNHLHKELANTYNLNHLSRPNRGEYKKSGNLEYGYRYSNGEFIFILDADFVPEKDALKDLIPYIVQDKEIGILQTPQYFEQTHAVHKRSKIEFGGGNIVEDFYRIILPCRDEFKAATCVGTSALYRRTAIAKLNGTPKVQASEDLATGLLITQYGFYVKYLPLIVSMGTSPDSYQSYFKQHLRWCSGILVFAKFWPKARLNLIARLIFLTSPLYYISEALAVIFSFQFLILLFFHSESLSIMHTLYFIPYMIVNTVLSPMLKVNKNRLGTKLAALNNSYTYFYTFLSLATKNIPTWHPTGLKTNNLHPDFLSQNTIGIVVSSSYIFFFILVLILRPQIFSNYNTYILLFWSLYSVFWHTSYLTTVAAFIHPRKLITVSTIADKLLLYTKTHVTFILFSVLCAVTVGDILNLLYTKHYPVLTVKNMSVNAPLALITKNDQTKDVMSSVSITTVALDTSYAQEQATHSAEVSGVAISQ